MPTNIAKITFVSGVIINGEQTEGTIKNGQYWDAGKIGHTRHRTKTNKHKNTTQKTKKMSYMDTTNQPRVHLGAREE